MADGAPVWNKFSSRTELARALAARIAGRLADAVRAKGGASLAVSGGSTPKLLFETLSEAAIAWPKVTVTLLDERFVDEASPRSNAGLARSALLRGRAADARFVPLRGVAATPAEAARDAAWRIEALLPLDVAVLGMGLDGHTASYFPDAAGLDALLDPMASEPVAVVEAASAGEPRLTLTMPVLLSADRVALHIEGEDKRAVLEAALAGRGKLPIRRVIEALPRPVEVYWAP